MVATFAAAARATVALRAGTTTRRHDDNDVFLVDVRHSLELAAWSSVMADPNACDYRRARSSGGNQNFLSPDLLALL
jgi:hypothetical protein